jgi:hypothetical protein
MWTRRAVLTRGETRGQLTQVQLTQVQLTQVQLTQGQLTQGQLTQGETRGWEETGRRITNPQRHCQPCRPLHGWPDIVYEDITGCHLIDFRVNCV